MTTSRTPEQIQTDLVQARANLEATVDDLAGRLDPRKHGRTLGLAAAGVVGTVGATRLLRKLVKRSRHH